MNGAFLIALNDMVVGQQGGPFWQSILAEVQPHSHGQYELCEDYQDRELADLLIAVSQKRSISVTDVQHELGEFLFKNKLSKTRLSAGLGSDLFDFLCSLECAMDSSIQQYLLDTEQAHIHCQRGDDGKTYLDYQSPHKLCFLLEGLVYGAADYYHNNIAIAHDQCMHLGHQRCSLQITMQS